MLRLSSISPDAKRLILLRFFRSFGQGALVVDLALYLKALGWHGTAIGLVMGITGLMAGGLSMVIGIVSDRLQRKPFLIMASILTVLCAITAFLTTQPVLLGTAIVLGGFGRGMNGAASFFAPAEQGWLAAVVPQALRGRIYSLNMAGGFIGMTVGAGIGALPGLMTPWMNELFAYRLIFWLLIGAAAVNLGLLSTLREKRPDPKPVVNSLSHSRRRSRENRSLFSMAGLNAVNGFSVGLVSPLISYWFAVRFGMGPADIAPFMAATFLLSAIGSLLAGRLTEQFGVVPAVTALRSGGLVLLLLIPVSPIYVLAATCYVLRSALNRGSIGARQALVVSLVGDDRRGFAVSLNAAAFQFSQAGGPILSGALMDAGQLFWPFYLAGILQGFYIAGYFLLFRRLDPQKPHRRNRSGVG